MTEDDLRIKLAEAMGWKHEQMRENLRRPSWQSPQGGDWIFPADLPDPETDANDDCAVLEWMRGKCPSINVNQTVKHYQWANNDECWRFFNALVNTIIIDYQIGDYARAALKVLKIS